MKKNVMKIAFMAAFAVIAGYGVSNSQQTEVMSDLMAANVEALAGVDDNWYCVGEKYTCLVDSQGEIKGQAIHHSINEMRVWKSNSVKDIKWCCFYIPS